MIIETPFKVQTSTGSQEFSTDQLAGAIRNAGTSSVSLMNGNPTYPAAVRENMNRNELTSADVVPGATTKMALYAIPLQAGDTISTLQFMTNTTAANTPSAQQASLYSLSSGTYTQLARSNDNGSTAWAAATIKRFTLGTSYSVPTAAVYYVGLSFAATTVPSLVGRNAGGTQHNGPFVTGQAVLAATTDAPGGTAPLTVTATTAVVGVAYVVAN